MKNTTTVIQRSTVDQKKGNEGDLKEGHSVLPVGRPISNFSVSSSPINPSCKSTHFHDFFLFEVCVFQRGEDRLVNL